MITNLVNGGTIVMLVLMTSILAYMTVTGRLPQRKGELSRLRDLETMVRVLQADHIKDVARIEQLEKELASAKEKIQFLEGQLSQYHKEAVQSDRVLLAVVGSDPALKGDLAALREVENECGFVVTRCFPARWSRFEATINRYRAAGNPIRYVHFSVHATPGDGAATGPGILFEDGLIGGEQLSGVLNGVEVAFIAGCDSDMLGDLIGVVPVVVTFREPVRHEHAILASKLFWVNLGKGLDARTAYRTARSRLPAEVAEFLELHQ